MKNEVGICNKCANVKAVNFGDGVSEPSITLFVCSVFGNEIEPIPEDERILNCEKFKNNYEKTNRTNKENGIKGIKY